MSRKKFRKMNRKMIRLAEFVFVNLRIMRRWNCCRVMMRRGNPAPTPISFINLVLSNGLKRKRSVHCVGNLIWMIWDNLSCSAVTKNRMTSRRGWDRRCRIRWSGTTPKALPKTTKSASNSKDSASTEASRAYPFWSGVIMWSTSHKIMKGYELY